MNSIGVAILKPLRGLGSLSAIKANPRVLAHTLKDAPFNFQQIPEKHEDDLCPMFVRTLGVSSSAMAPSFKTRILS